VAATAVGGDTTPTWVISGTDRAGVDSAASALSPARLSDAFALVISRGRSLSVPRDPSS
jgi:hypothetical protein